MLVMVQKANRHHHKHPDEPIVYEPFKAQVDGTLVISAITLVVTLVGLLIAVPANKWVLSRKIGYTTIALWAVSTAVNVVVEITGAWGEI
jgi:sodium/potassium/calcium exchanger 6